MSVEILHKTLGVITIITSVFGARIVTSDKKYVNLQIMLALVDKCCYNVDCWRTRPGGREIVPIIG